jgi:hypothetical protein
MVLLAFLGCCCVHVGPGGGRLDEAQWMKHSGKLWLSLVPLLLLAVLQAT